MQLRELTIQKENNALPTQLDFFQILSLRGSNHFIEEKKLYKSLEAGYHGEQKVINYIQKYGLSHWTVLQNVWMQEFDRFECDIILITSQTVYVFEVKNYKGTFSYDNGKCYYDFIETRLNPIEQLRGNMVTLKKICAKFSPNIPVKGAVIFSGKDHEVHINACPDDIEIITSNGIRNFILKLAAEERTSHAAQVNTDKIIQVFNQHEIPHPYLPDPLTSDEMKEIKPGIYCVNCNNYHVKITRQVVKCACGQTESREEANIRTICDYGVLNYKSELSLGQLLPFFNKQVSRTSLIDNLSKHFIVVKNSRYTYYINLKLPYEKTKHLFTIKLPRIFYLQNGDRIIKTT